MSKAVIFDIVRKALNFDYYDMYLAKGLVDPTTQIKDRAGAKVFGNSSCLS